jgi:hypothetical protein
MDASKLFGMLSVIPGVMGMAVMVKGGRSFYQSMTEPAKDHEADA